MRGARPELGESYVNLFFLPRSLSGLIKQAVFQGRGLIHSPPFSVTEDEATLGRTLTSQSQAKPVSIRWSVVGRSIRSVSPV